MSKDNKGVKEKKAAEKVEKKVAQKTEKTAAEKTEKTAAQKKDKKGNKKRRRFVEPGARREPTHYSIYRKFPKIPSRKHLHKPTRLRRSITPGTVLIVLAGRFKGKRVVFLKQLKSGLLLVTGPYRVNGVPLRRVNQTYVIATSTKVDVSQVNVEKINDTLFARAPKPKPTGPKGSAEFFKDGKKPTKRIAEARITAQKAVDKPLIEAVTKVPKLKEYLIARFSLTNKTFPHSIRF